MAQRQSIPLIIDFDARLVVEEEYESYALLVANASLDSDSFVRILGHRMDKHGKFIAATTGGVEGLQDWLKSKSVSTFGKPKMMHYFKVILFDVLSGLCYLIKKKLKFKPLTMENIVIDEKGRAKIKHVNIIFDGSFEEKKNMHDPFGLRKIFEDAKFVNGTPQQEELSYFLDIFNSALCNQKLEYINNPWLWPPRIRLMYRAQGYDDLGFKISNVRGELKKMEHPWMEEAIRKGGEFNTILGMGKHTNNGLSFLRYSRAVAYHACMNLSSFDLEHVLTSIWPKFMLIEYD